MSCGGGLVMWGTRAAADGPGGSRGAVSDGAGISGGAGGSHGPGISHGPGGSGGPGGRND